jgi:cell division protein FtsQ
VPLALRRTELEQLPWVEHATVMRLLPDQLRVSVVERVPVAFVRAGNQIGLIDRQGVLLDMPPAMMAAKRYSFPVVTGVLPQQSAEDRGSRMRLYADFMSALNSTGGEASSQVSEVDLSDPEDVRVLLPSAGSDLLVHFGSEDFAARWQRLEAKLPAWRQQYPRLAGVDLRYQRQTVLEMAKSGIGEASTSSAASPSSAQATAAVAKRPAAGPVRHNRASIPRDIPHRGTSAANRSVKKAPNATKKPVHKPTSAQRDTNG